MFPNRLIFYKSSKIILTKIAKTVLRNTYKTYSKLLHCIAETNMRKYIIKIAKVPWNECLSIGQGKKKKKEDKEQEG